MTVTPALRAASNSRAALPTIRAARASSASWGKIASGPMTPFCISEATTAVRLGSTRVGRSTGIGGSSGDEAVGEGLQVLEGRARRVPRDDDEAVNTRPGEGVDVRVVADGA